ncbi:hypothetical protein BJX68DRAFT_243949 [Aspergillus pseudodeflectus]|uniref:Uncharacterized protein n=1 Tax=Aspergillus pseudodeflectus TaxID=176178 RepID=A0ABR4JTN8_9EURO
MSCPIDTPAQTIMSSLRRSPSGRGYTHLACDGVLRAISGDNKVVDYRRLSPEDIQTVMQVFPQKYRDQVKDKFVGVDGRDVTNEEQLWNPSEELVPRRKERSGVEAPSSTPAG